MSSFLTWLLITLGTIYVIIYLVLFAKKLKSKKKNNTNENKIIEKEIKNE